MITQLVNWCLFSKFNGKLLTGLKLGKTSSMPSFSMRGLTGAFSTLQDSIQFEGICLLKVLIRDAENRGIPSRAMLELGHCCTVYLVIVWSVSWHHSLSGVRKKGTCLLLSLAPLESWLVPDPDCPILFWFSESSLKRIRQMRPPDLSMSRGIAFVLMVRGLS